MHGDWSRIRFNPANQYAAVVKQQGRIDLDSDNLEQHAIDLTLRQTINTDVIGPFGGPEDDAGFAITVNSTTSGYTITIGPGRYYVNGLLVENPSNVAYDEQPYLIEPADNANSLMSKLAAASAGATVGFTLQAWVRMVTALDDPSLLEPALGGADTTVRLQTVWRVIGTVIPASTGGGSNNTSGDPISKLAPACQAMYNQRVGDMHTGQLSASLAQSGSECGCQPIAPAGYQGLENQLYRVEIHHGGDLTSATFKWSRENGSVVTAVTAVNGAIVTVASLGPDANLGFTAGQWVELSDDSYLFGETPNQPGVLCQIQGVNPATMQVTMMAPVTAKIDPTRNARMRRWDQSGGSATASGIPVSRASIALENGVEVSFSPGSYEPGDFWTIPARTATGQILWPPNGSTGAFQRSSYMQIQQAPVASVILQAANAEHLRLPQTSDCRLLFPPLIDVNPSVAPPALHVTKINWTNDDVMTVDTLLQNGLAVTFDQAPTCPFGGGNFKVTLEPPMLADVAGSYATMVQTLSAGGETPAGTDVFLRTVFDLDPPQGLTISGSQAVWLPALSTQNMAAAGLLWTVLNLAVSALNPTGFGRVRVRLDGGAVYGAGNAGNIYLDGQTFGTTATRASDGAACVNLKLPSGNGATASDFVSWFYLAPSVLIKSVTIMGTVQGASQSLSAITLQINPQGVVQQIFVGNAAQGSTVTNIEASIVLNYAPLASTPVTLTLSGTPMPGAGTIASIPATVTAAKGAAKVTAPITFQGNPPTPTTNAAGTAAPYQLTLNASVTTAVRSLSVSSSVLSVTVVVVTPLT